jgi:hypothetical protein
MDLYFKFFQSNGVANPFTLAFKSPKSSLNKRKQKQYLTSPYGSLNSHNYIDAIGVPRGVPNESKARNKIASGFESALFWWYMIYKNVDWINYIWYKQERFMNYIQDALKGMTCQLVKWHGKTEWL